jgi:hypothetical protein
MRIDELLQLEQPLKDGGIRNVNFFNGRLLTSKDLTREQAARTQADARLGLALGEGVAYGLEVKPDSSLDVPALRITPGLAVNRQGQALCLSQETSVALVRSFATLATEACIFAPCTKTKEGTYVAGAGVYVLTIAPTSTAEGHAQTNGLDPLNVRCNTDTTVDALMFRLQCVPTKILEGLDYGAASFRNQLAYRGFGAGVHASHFASLLTAAPRSDDLVDALRAISLGDKEVPLALLFLRGAATIGFVDMWAVRRPLAHRETGGLSGLVERSRLAKGHAMFMQFQTQISELGNPVVIPATVTAKSHFRYLPPVGVIPVPEESDETDAQATRFFAGMTYRGPAFINAARLESLVRESLCYPPIDTESGEFVWLYRVRENRMGIDAGLTKPAPRSYLVFASGHLPYRADAQFDAAYWNYANYALR